jgi:hypothetical protein
LLELVNNHDKAKVASILYQQCHALEKSEQAKGNILKVKVSAIELVGDWKNSYAACNSWRLSGSRCDSHS